MENKLGKIKQIDLRKAWNHEAYHFTNWLAEDENLALLSDEIGIDIKLIQKEASVGKFNLDILAEEENTGRKIIIENQLEKTDHDHLGKVITYASGFDAEIIIWIVRDVCEEHKQAIDWLNEHTDEKIYFFAIKMELWQIGDSPFAPKFQVISEPNEWAKAVKSSAGSTMTETTAMQLDFWKQFVEHAKNETKVLRFRKVRPQHFYDISLGNSCSHIGLTINTQENQIACEVYISDKKELFNALHEQRDQLEAELNEKLEWMALEGRKASRIKLTTEADITNTETWENSFEWLTDKAEKFKKVFPKYIKNCLKRVD